MARHPLVDQRVAGAAVKCQQLAVFPDIGDVRDAADIDEHNRFFVGPFARQP